MRDRVIELVTFSLVAGTDATAFSTAAGRTMSFLRRQPGFLRRELSVSATGEWADIVVWSDLNAALQAAERFRTADETQDFKRMIDPATARMRHLTVTLAVSLQQ
jgi:hypothetical protein